MSVAGPAGLELASLPRRGLASVIDVAVFLPVLGGAGVAGVKLYSAFAGKDPSWFGPAVQSRRWGLALEGASVPIEVWLRNSRSPGARALGLRRVDARTGGPISVRSVLVRTAFQTVSRELRRPVNRPFERRLAERGELVEAELAEVRRIHANDAKARARASLDVYKRHGFGPAAPIVRALVKVLPLYLPAVWSPRNQTLPERAAGIVTVRD